MPAIRGSSRQPRERAERTGDPGPHNRRLRAHGQHVSADRGEGCELPEDAAHSEQPRQHEHTSGDKSDVLTGDGEKVIQAGGAKAPAQILAKPAVLTEQDALEDCGSLAFEAPCCRPLELTTKRVGDPAEATATPCVMPAVH